MPDNFPDLAQSGYTLTPIDSGGVKRPAAPSQEPLDVHEISLAKRPKKDNRNDPIKSSLRSSKISMLKETTGKLPTRRHSICYPTRQNESKMEEMNDINEEDNNRGNTSPTSSDVSMRYLRNQPTILLSSLKTNEELRKSNDDLFSGSNNDASSAENSMNTSLNSSTSKRLLFDGIKKSTKKRLSLYPSLNTSFKKVPVSNVVASAEDYEKDREDEQKRVTEMLKEITEEHENKNKKEEKLSATKTSTTLPPTTSSTATTATISFGTTKLPEASKPQTTLVVSTAVTSLTANPVTTTSSIGKTLESGMPSSSLGLSALTSVTSLVSTASSTAATPSNYTFKPVFGAASTATTATTSVVSSTTTTSTPTGFSIASGVLGASSFKLGSGFDVPVPKTSNVLPGITTSLLTSTSSLNGGFKTSSTTAAFPSMKPISNTTNPSKNGGGFTFGNTSSGKEQTPSFAFGHTSQAVTSTHQSTAASVTNFGQRAQATQINSNTGPSVLQSNFSFGQNQASTGGFGFGGATALSALSALSGLSSAPQATPTTNPPPYSLNAGGQLSGITSGMPKPTFNFGNIAQTTSSASSTFGSSSTNESGSDFGVNTSASTTGGAFQFGAPMTPSTPAAPPSNINAKPSFGTSSTSGFAFGQNKPPTTTVQNATGFSFGGGQLATASNSTSFGTTVSSKPFTFGSAQPAPGGFSSSNPPPAFGSTNTSASFGNNQSVQASPFGTGNNKTATGFGGTSGNTFGSTQPAFGNSQQNSSTSVFGQSSSTTAFGNNTPQSTPSFGQSGSIFGTSNQNTSSFGQPNCTVQSSNASVAPIASFQFGQTTRAKPNIPAPTFGQSNTSQNSGFNFAAPGSNPSFNFGGSSTPGTGPAPAGAFGTPTTPTNLFTPGSVNSARVPSSRPRRSRTRR
ncbi:hypothetical protein LOTGIDRAFT_233991 [Lottia gigantea]|uniref:Uncharacterized protein n=1 Tax=Lottia gigantea TaxID=225164 RepID=V3ZFE0_LOTGI|nr:hypothetical protein LOTGIDRAFT_233991 [Lottia gigantea]ESO89838.1 hypothetical protein LOTGIDRAFT_233991 [Lottia gigantea]